MVFFVALIQSALNLFVFGCVPRDQQIGLTHGHFKDKAKERCIEKFGWRDAWPDPNMVFFENEVYVTVYPSQEESMRNVEHPESALVLMDLEGKLLSVESNFE